MSSMIPIELQKKVAQLRQEFVGEENHKEIDIREKVVMDRIKFARLKSVDGVKEIIQDARERVNSLNISLAYDDSLTELERARLIERRNFFDTYILRRFGAYKMADALKALEEYVDEKLQLK